MSYLIMMPTARRYKVPNRPDTGPLIYSNYNAIYFEARLTMPSILELTAGTSAKFVKRLGIVAALTITAKFTPVNIVARMTRDTLLRQLNFPANFDRINMASQTIQILMGSR